jgi:hypothetical protein
MSVCSPNLRTKAIRLPSGDQSGSKLGDTSPPAEQPQCSALPLAPPARPANSAAAPRMHNIRPFISTSMVLSFGDENRGGR